MSVLDLPPVPILLYRAQVIPPWEREWWAIPQDVVTALRLRDAEFYIHPAFCTGLEIEGWGVSVAGAVVDVMVERDENVCRVCVRR